MAQLNTLIWLKWRLFRNSLRSSKAVVYRVASALGVLLALALSLLMAFGLGAAAYALTSPGFSLHLAQTATNASSRGFPSVEFIFFSIFSMSYLIWATVPVSVGNTRQFDPGNLLLYPISLRKLFGLDLVSEIASIPSIFALPSILAMGIGAGLAQNQLLRGFLVAVAAGVFGIVLAKWVSTSANSLFKKKQSKGESLLALLGTLVGLLGLLFTQVGPTMFHRVESISLLRWTPPGAIAFTLTRGLQPDSAANYLLALTVFGVYTAVFVVITYWLARRTALGSGGSGRQRRLTSTNQAYTGWDVPLFSSTVSGFLEKEFRYVMRNAQLRMMAAMPLILIAGRLMNQKRFGQAAMQQASNGLMREIMIYGEGIMASVGVLYVCLILSGISCNLFAFEDSGMRTFVLSPIKRSQILFAKNVVTTVVTAVFSGALLIVNELVFRDLTWRALAFASLSFLVYVPLMAVMGNSLSIRFPKRMKFGRRFNVSGAVGLLLIPMMLILAAPPIASIAAGFVAQSFVVEYVTLAVLALFSIGLYLLVIKAQGDLLQQKELEVLEAVNDPGSD